MTCIIQTGPVVSPTGQLLRRYNMQKIPVLLEQCQHIYTLMDKEAEEDEESGAYLWKGALTQLFERAGYGQPNYTRVTTALQNMGCIFQVQRGAGSKPSIWEVREKPTEPLFEEKKDGPEDDGPDPLLTRVNELTALVSEYEERVANLEHDQHMLFKQIEKVMNNGKN